MRWSTTRADLSLDSHVATIARVPDVLIYADTVRSPELRHEVPVVAPDAMIYVEREGRRLVYASPLEVSRLQALDDLQPVGFEELGLDELIEAGCDWHEIDRELVLRACRHADAQAVVVPRTFPLEMADHLRAHGIEIQADGALFDARRRRKTQAELDGMKRALRASEQAYDRARELLRQGGELTCEELRAAITRVLTDGGMTLPELLIVSHGPQTADGHEPGHGRIEAGEPVVIDLYPRDTESGCYSDMTRTFCIGEPPEQLLTYHRLCVEVFERVYAAIRPGVTGRQLFDLACDVFEREGYPTQRTKLPGEWLEDGFTHSLGHGVGFEVHEPPALGRMGADALVAGDVLAVEPGLYAKDFGGCCLEDLVLVTDDGCEVLSAYRYDLTP
jgi:Xaa-Pro aminopeptidase